MHIMEPIKFDIFGGCTSRDLFNFENACGQVNRYFARSSLVSQYTDPIVSLQKSVFDTGSNFSNNMVLSDIRKNFFNYFRGSAPKGDYLILDLLIERVPILTYQNGFLTRTIEFTKAKIDIGREVRITKEDHLALFRSIAPQLAEDLKVYRKVFLHKALSRTKYISNNQQIIDFKHIEEIATTNNFLNSLYEILEQNIPNLEIMALNDFYGWEGHRWGLSSFHYEDEYYTLLNKRINNIIQTDNLARIPA